MSTLGAVTGTWPVRGEGAPPWAEQARRNLDAAMAGLLAGNDTAEGSPVKNAVIRLEVPESGFVYEKGVGRANADSVAPMTPDHQYHLASVTKTMTAVLVLQLWEEGALGAKGLEAPLAEFDLFDDEIIARLHVMDGVSYGRKITVRQLLTHTSGIKDAAIDDATGTAADFGGPAPGSYVARLRADLKGHLACLNDPDRDPTPLMTCKNWMMWDPRCPDDREAGVINWFLASGTAASPLSRPGEAFHYSDTGYVILGLLVEQLSGLDLHAQWRRRIFDPLGMAKSYLAYATDPDPSPWVHAVSDYYLGDVPGVTSRLNLSFDRGGGGVVSTVRDMNRFLRALVNGELFRHGETLVRMTQWRMAPGIKPPRAGVGLGIFAEDTGHGTIAVGHSGAYGAKMYYEPETGIFFNGTVNQRQGVPYYWWTAMLKAVQEARQL
ncbi:MAG: beta-lactamase family protein [Ardenticatenaceae bacterium]|nr:beta-lactamase family protein [Ardenticatenaceae bacterium]